MFDGVGHGVFGRVAQKMTVRYSGKRTADDVILDLTSEAAMEAGAGKAGAEAVLAVTNDRELRERLHAKGARTVQLQWLISRMDLPVLAAGPWATGDRRRWAPGGLRDAPNDDGADDRPGWKPGRGATTKTGPARKVARHKRHPRHPA